MKIHHDSYKQIAELYLAGESSRSISEKFGVSDVTILNVLRKINVPRRDSSRARIVYPIWHEAFSVITPESAYWIGFLMADGSVIDQTKIQLALKQEDKNHLEKFRAFLRTENRPIYSVPSTNSCAIKVHSEQMVKDLSQYGVVRRKSLIAEALCEIDMQPTFWLGVFDGDGCVDIRKQLRVRMCGAKTLMLQFLNFLECYKIHGRNKSYRVSMCQSGSVSEVCLLGQRAINFLQFAYSNCPVKLDRKHTIASKFL
jgi:hypothetical protein